MGLDAIGKMILTLGLILVLVGGSLVLLGKLGLGRLPGDILMQRGNTTFYFPVATSIIVSLVLTLILNLILRR
jgi:multisubunit Na+/H+ antiporter MnhG subunit